MYSIAMCTLAPPPTQTVVEYPRFLPAMLGAEADKVPLLVGSG